jgi:hypothetical protein
MGQSKMKYRIKERGNICLNVTLRRVRVTVVAVYKQEALRILGVCLQP